MVKRGRSTTTDQVVDHQIALPVRGGRYLPLTNAEIEKIHHAALNVLENIGMAGATPELIELARHAGCVFGDDNRLRFSKSWMEDLIERLPKRITLHGRLCDEQSVELGCGLTHYSTGGVAVRMVDINTGAYHPSTLKDLYQCAQVVDVCSNLHVFNRTVVATEITDLREFDLSIAYTCVAGTTKPIGTGFNHTDYLEETVRMFDYILGGEGQFRQRPFSTCNTCAIVPPLRFGEDNTTVAMAAARHNFPVKMVVAAQAGATAPASLTGTLVQTVAETLAGCAMVQLANPGAPVIYANWPFVSDLRTGSFSGGGGEMALLNAASAQIARWYGLPHAVSAGMTDAKEPDAQYGYEKGMTDLAAGLAGADVIYESAGMMGSLIGCSLESLIIDNEMLASARRTIQGIDVNDESLSINVIKEVCMGGPGHYLGHEQTLALMKSEYEYPQLASRESPDQWEETGRPQLREKARQRAREIVAEARPKVPRHIEQAIAKKYPIQPMWK